MTNTTVNWHGWTHSSHRARRQKLFKRGQPQYREKEPARIELRKSFSRGKRARLDSPISSNVLVRIYADKTFDISCNERIPMNKNDMRQLHEVIVHVVDNWSQIHAG